MSILIDTARIFSFRGLQNIEVKLDKTTILTGMNNTGKTSFLKALQLSFGNRQFVSHDDFFIHGSNISNKIIIDILIVPYDEFAGKSVDVFREEWEILFTTDRIRSDDNGNTFVPLRTIVQFDKIKNAFSSQQYILKYWPPFEKDDNYWYDFDNGNKTVFHFDEIPFYYMDAQRDILEDTKLRNSYIGRMLSKIEYSPKDIKEIEKQIKFLNEKAVNSSEILSNIKATLKELNTAMDNSGEGVEITPFTKKIRDLNKGLTIYYKENQESFSMEYHGMGTRSWSSLLTLKSFVELLSINSKKEGSIFFPILSIEEPEAHLHPNAQKKLFAQVESIPGQKIISTHSPYIAATAELNQIRNFYKNDLVTCGSVDTKVLLKEDIRKIKRQVINTRGEILFSKLLIFFEGETEEQALPIFAQQHFGKSCVELGFNFVGVGGYGGYLPFIRFSEAFKIPWIIFSDAENSPENNVKDKVVKQFSKCGSTKDKKECILFIDDGNDFEKQMICDGFGDEIRKAIVSLCDYKNKAKELELIKEIEGYDEDKLYNIITGNKTQYGPAIALEIVKSKKNLPPKVLELFSMIKSNLKLVEAEA